MEEPNDKVRFHRARVIRIAFARVTVADISWSGAMNAV